MSERDDIYGGGAPSAAGAPDASGGRDGVRVRERALAAQRLAEAAKRLAPAHGDAAQRAAWQDAQVASIMAGEALAAQDGDPDLARAMAEEAQSLAIEALKAAQSAAPALAEPAPAQPAAQVPAQPVVPEPVQPAVPPEPASASKSAPSAVLSGGGEAAAAEGSRAVPTQALPTEALPTAPAAPAPAAAPKPPHRLRTACIALACLLALMAGLVLAAWFGLFKLPDPVQERLYLLPDPHAQAGALNAADVEVPPGGFQLVLAQLCAMEAGSLDCPVQFENPAANAYSARLVLEVDGEEVARSGMVAPGSYLGAVRLDHALPAGEHEARAVVCVYSGATQVNALASDVTIRVK